MNITLFTVQKRNQEHYKEEEKN